MTKTMAMVKADAYGTGILEVARWLENGHIDYLGVAFSQEACCFARRELWRLLW